MVQEGMGGWFDGICMYRFYGGGGPVVLRGCWLKYGKGLLGWLDQLDSLAAADALGSRETRAGVSVFCKLQLRALVIVFVAHACMHTCMHYCMCAWEVWGIPICVEWGLVIPVGCRKRRRMNRPNKRRRAQHKSFWSTNLKMPFLLRTDIVTLLAFIFLISQDAKQ